MTTDRRMSPSPAAPQLSKRDKRRNNITERLTEMITTFSDDQHEHYRAQLQAIQVDMSLIMGASPYLNEPLADLAEDIEQQVDRLVNSSVPPLPQVTSEAAKKDFYALAGRRYHEYVQDINKAMEQRDADLTALMNRYESSLAETERNTSIKIQVAQREHLELASTIRSRLMNSVTKKRDKLLREKEQLDIADSSALFLHPSQFTMNIPGSPGGAAATNRKTRHTRHRIDPDEAAAAASRKRKAHDDDATDSPVPSFRPFMSDNQRPGSPFRNAKSRIIYTQYEAPAYSIDRLFTEKELAHATTIAQVATHNFFHQHQQQHQQQQLQNGHVPHDGAPHTNGYRSSAMSLDGAVVDAATATATAAAAAAAAAASSVPAALNNDAEDAAVTNGTPPASQLVAPEMERNISHHGTRAATRANPLAALSEAAALTSNPSTNTFIPALIPITRTDKGAPTPPGASVLDADADMAFILKAEEHMHRVTHSADDADDLRTQDPVRQQNDRLLERACSYPVGTAPYRLANIETGPSALDERTGVNRAAYLGYADPNGFTRFGAAAPAADTANSLYALGSAAASLENAGANSAAGGAAAALAALGSGSFAARPGAFLATRAVQDSPAAGATMSRSTSFAGSEAGAEVGGTGMRRVRSRF